MGGKKPIILSMIFILLFLLGIPTASSGPDIQADTTIIPWLSGGYRYLQIPVGSTPPGGYNLPAFNDDAWPVGNAAFGTLLGPDAACTLNTTVQTTWSVNTEIIVRRDFTLPSGTTNLRVELGIDNDLVGMWLNGVQISGFMLHDNCPVRGDLGMISAPDSALVAGTNTLVIRALDRGVSSYLDIQVMADLSGVAPLTITTTSPLPSATAGEAYGMMLSATGGVGAYTWSVVGGALPAGLSVNPATGMISGTPTTTGVSTFPVQVMDEIGTTTQKQFTLEVVAATPFLIITDTLPDGTVGVPYSAQLQAQGGTSYTWSVIGGTLPPGLTLGPDGSLTGTPTTPGPFTFTVQVTDSGTGETTSKEFTVTIADVTLPPVLTSISPNSATAGDPAFTLTATGENFVATSVVYWNGAARPTTFVSPTELTAEIPASDIASLGTADVTVVTPGSGTSNALPFTIDPAPLLILTGSLPDGVVGVPYSAQLQGQGGSSLYTWSVTGGALPPGLTLGPDGSLTGTPTTAGPFTFTVQLADDETGQTTTGEFTVTILEEVPPTPVLTSISPNSATAGDPAFTLTATGENFVPTSVVYWNGAARPTTFVSPTELTAEIPASDIASMGSADVTVVTPGGGTSNALPFTIDPAPLLILTGSLPDGTVGVPYSAQLQAQGGSSLYTWSVTGGTLPPGLTLGPDGSLTGTPTTAGPFTFTVQVTDDETGQTTTGEFTVTIAASTLPPTLTSISPNSATAGDPAFMLTATGENFLPTSVVYWNGAARPTTFVSPTELTAAIPASDIAGVGIAEVRVITPGVGRSNALSFVIGEPIPTNTAPVAMDDTITLDEDTSALKDVAANDSDIDGNLDLSSVSIVSPPSNGMLQNHGDGTVTYTPNPNFNGTDQFTYQICDTEGECDQADVSITVNSVNDAPAVSIGQASVTVNEGATATNTIMANDVEGEAVTVAASAGTVADNGGGNWTWSFSATDGPSQSQVVTITATDTSGGVTEMTFNLTVNNVAPAANAGADQTVYRNAAVNLSGTWSDPAAGADNPYSWAWDLDGDAVPDSSGSANYGATANATTSFALEGTYVLTFSVSDKDGAAGSDSVVITVLNQPPVCSSASPSRDSLWPPNHQMEGINILGVTDPEGDPISITISSIFQDEPVNDTGDGNTAPDGQGVGTSSAQVRVERSGNKNARVYHISFAANDGHGGSCEGTVRVGVVHDQRKDAELIDEGPLYDSTVK